MSQEMNREQEIAHRVEENRAVEAGDAAAEVTDSSESQDARGGDRNIRAWGISLAVVGVFLLVALLFIWSKQSGTSMTAVSVGVEKNDEHGDEHSEGAKEVRLDPETLESAGIEIEGL